MATKPLVLPEPFNGDASWQQWRYHFDNVAVVNNWSDEDKLKWLKVRLIGRAQTAFQRLSAANQASFDLATKALKERFEPSSQKSRYQAELRTRKKKSAETWADLAEDLRLIADKAYPDLGDDARETLALNTFLAQIDNPHLAFGVKQRTPASLDAAVTATLELESYLSPKMTIAAITDAQQNPEQVEKVDCNAVSRRRDDVPSEQVATLLEKLIVRVEKLEAGTQQRDQYDSQPGAANIRREGTYTHQGHEWTAEGVGRVEGAAT